MVLNALTEEDRELSLPFDSSRGSESSVLRSVLVADPDEYWQRRVVNHLGKRCAKVLVCQSTRELRELAWRHRPDLVLLELRLIDGPTLSSIGWLRENHLTTRIVVVTNHDSVATAVRCSILGVDRYYVKSALLLKPAEARAEPPVPQRPMPLARAVWEQVNRAVDQAGSITAAAEELGLDRRSLRRMLGKYSPPA